VIKLTLSFRDRILKVYHPTGARVLIGRDSDCDVQIDNLAVSPVHAQISVEDGRAVLTNSGEQGSILVNGEPVEERELNDGDSLEIGKHTLTFAQNGANGVAAEDPQATALPTGWLQFMNGPKLGRTIRLDRNLVRLGKAGDQSAMIAGRQDGYYISHLEGKVPTRVQDEPLGEDSRKLQEGDTIQIGDTRVLFFLDDR
jgi:predicted component of type VI protein secretion system